MDDSADAQELDEVTARLRDELLQLDVLVTPSDAGHGPEGSRAVLSFTVGGLVIALAGTELLAAIVEAVTAWLTRNRSRAVKLEIEGDVLELTGVDAGEQRRLTEVWLRRRQSTPTPPAGRRTALIVAGDQYQDPGLRRLRAPALDAEALARVLGDPAIGGFAVRTMVNEPTPVVNEAVEEFFADRDPDDLLLLHFSGHGVKDDSGELYFATPTTKLNRLGATAVSAEFVNRRMSRSRSRRIVLLLDCCYAGAFARGALPRAGVDVHVEEQFGGRGRVVITASNAMEYAFDGPDLADSRESSPSVFTSALVEGLGTGEADRDQDGYVGIHELYDYVYERVRATTPHQTPGKWTYDVQGDLVIARRSRPVDRPAPLPPELQEAIDHPLPKIRSGAVGELDRLRRSRHAGLALAARLALEELTRDDSRSVSAAAAKALERPTQPPSSGTPSAPPAPAAPVVPEVAAHAVTTGGEQADTAADAPITTGSSPEPVQAAERSGASPAAEPTAASTPKVPAAVPGQGKRTLRALAVLSGLLLLIGPIEISGMGLPVAGDSAVWMWSLFAASLAVGLLREGAWRAASLGASAGLAAVHLGVFATYFRDGGVLRSFELNLPIGNLAITVVACALILAVVLVETALAQQGRRWKAIGLAGALLALLAIFVDLQNHHDLIDDPGEKPGWLWVFVTAALFLALFLTRTIQRLRAGETRLPLALGAAATLLVVVDILGVYLTQTGSDYQQIPAYVPALLVLLLMAAQTPGAPWVRLAAAQFTVIAGLLHNLAMVPRGPLFVAVLLVAAGVAVRTSQVSAAEYRV
ncbi:caspase, EACC1-associated type [Nonomuraea sediminis]|uniref:caspase, EACC1-associated type n=1 Tax=Nonomuraea sediminis TaxID=2835864 RepID=UPI001BDCEF67|nr:caspase family protein [Nonomuraea sediminis]